MSGSACKKKDQQRAGGCQSADRCNIRWVWKRFWHTAFAGDWERMGQQAVTLLEEITTGKKQNEDIIIPYQISGIL